MLIDCNAILENYKSKELTGKEELIFVPAVIDLNDIVHFRQSTTDSGDIEDYIIIYTKTTGSLCIDLSFIEFRNLFFKFKKNDSKII
jgi:hypothetical protein